MPTPFLYSGYEIQIDVFQQTAGLSKGMWGSTYRIRKQDGDISVSVVAAAREKTLELAQRKAHKRAMLMIDERNHQCVHMHAGREPALETRHAREAAHLALPANNP